MKIYNLLLFFLILSSGLVSASPLELTFLKENYFVGEPIQGEIYLDNVISSISIISLSLPARSISSTSSQTGIE